MSFFGKHPPTKPLSNFDMELQGFYHELISIILEKEKTKKVLIETLKQNRIKRIQKNEKVNSKAALHNTAHLFRYGPCYTSAVANHMLRMINNNPFIFQDALMRRYVNICCFGSASIIEIVAICKIFSLADESFWKSTQKPMQIKVTVIGNSIGRWKKTVNYASQVLLKTNSIFNSSKMTINVHLSKANPFSLLSNSVMNILKEADIVTMVNFVSMIRLETLSDQIIWEVADSMRMDGVLFFLDTGMFPVCKSYQRVLEPFDSFQNIFGPNNIEAFTLNINSVQKCVKLFWGKFQQNICLTSCIVNSAVWMKAEPLTQCNGTDKITSASRNVSRSDRLEKILNAKREWCEKQPLSQRTLEEYHEKVRQVLPKKSSKKQDDDPLWYLLDYPKLKRSVLFKSKSKDKRIYL